MLDYCQPIHTSEGFILSIDKVIIDYRLNDIGAVTALGQLLDTLPIRFAVTTKRWESHKIGSFRENISVSFQNHDSYWLGAMLNSTRVEYNRVRLEFNPNKCALHDSFLSVLAFLTWRRQ